MAADAVSKTTRVYLSKYDSPTSSLLNRIWGGHLHMGLFEDDQEPLLDAQMRVNLRMAEAATLRPGDKVLEVACGVGGAARFLAGRYSVFVLATNIAGAQIDEANRLSESKGFSDSVKHAVVDFHDLPCADDAFDCWWCQEALLYSTNKRRVLSEALRVVRPGGRVILSDLVLSANMPGGARNHLTTALHAPGLWSIEQWDELLANIGAEIIERQDWSQHTKPTFEHVLEALKEASDEIQVLIGDNAVEGTFNRVGLQLEAAKSGDLGWCFYAITA